MVGEGCRETEGKNVRGTEVRTQKERRRITKPRDLRSKTTFGERERIGEEKTEKDMAVGSSPFLRGEEY